MPTGSTTSLRSGAPSASAREAAVRGRDRRLARWALLGGGALLAGLLLVQAALVELVYPALALAAGVLLYRHYPVRYVGYAWWLFFLTPEVRRLVDWQSGRTELSPIMLAPWLVAGLAAFGALRPSSRAWKSRWAGPFWLVLAGIVLGYAVGLWRAGPFAATYGTLVWAVPVVFGMHVVQMGRERYPALRRTLKRTFLRGTLLMGVYGIVQYFVVPPWDGTWMVESEMASIGVPEPQQVRVFSTLNSPGPFAQVMMAGLLLLFVTRSRWRLLATGAGYAAFLLSLVRSSWLGWLVGVFFLMGKAEQRQRRRLVLGLAAAGAVVAGIALFSPLGETIGDRMSTFANLEEDGSFQKRLVIFRNAQALVFNSPLGAGIGNTTGTKLSTEEARFIDNGLFQVPNELGWLGALLYAAGVGWLVVRGWRASRRSRNAFVAISYGTAIAVLTMMVAVNTLIDLAGMIFWTFAAVVLAHSRPQRFNGSVHAGAPASVAGAPAGDEQSANPVST